MNSIMEVLNEEKSFYSYYVYLFDNNRVQNA